MSEQIASRNAGGFRQVEICKMFILHGDQMSRQLEEKGFKGEQVADLRAQWMRHKRKRMLGAGSRTGKEKKGWTMFAGDFIVEKVL